ncbi:MAG: ATP-binding protein [Candidatus Krumholzibacteriia bacterium]
MASARDRALPMAVILCLAGQGGLLVASGKATPSPHPFLPGAFLALVLVVLTATAIATRGGRVRHATPGFASLKPLALVLLAVQLGLALAQFPSTVPAASRFPGESSAALAAAEEHLEGMLEELEATGAHLQGALASGRAEDRDLFALGRSVQALWSRTGAAGFPLELVFWRGEERVAWTSRAEPLTPRGDPWLRENPGRADRLLEQGRHSWVLRDLGVTAGGVQAEIQVPLAEGVLEPMIPGVVLQVLGPGKAAQLNRTDPTAGRNIHLVAADGEPVARITAAEGARGQGGDLIRVRLFLASFGVWMLSLPVLVGLLLPGAGWILALWAGRAGLAAVDFFRWLPLSFPGQEFPADPPSPASLCDPAYFATPVGFGLFASVADALLTTAVLGLSGWWLMARRGMAGDGPAWRSPFAGRGPAAALAFGLSGGFVLLLLRGFTGLVAANANARLIGTGVPLSSLSFWGLHLVLMGTGFVAASLLAALVRGDRDLREAAPPEQAVSLPGVFAGGIAAVGLSGTATWSTAALAAVLVLLFWILAPGLGAGHRFLRRWTWPALLLVMVVWTHASLRGVYEQAERSWLQRKSDLITEADEEWTRFLLGSLLEDMSTQDAAAGKADTRDTGIWRDEAAWSLWRNSALSDLGVSCLVELLDEQEREASLITLGFLGDFQYEVVRRSPWVREEGTLEAQGPGSLFQTELRSYGGGSEYIMIGERERLDGRGWIRVEIPVRSWRIATLKAQVTGGETGNGRTYRPRAEVDRPVILLRGDAHGWLDAGSQAFPSDDSAIVPAMAAGRQAWGEIEADGARWLGLWKPLPRAAARTMGEGFLLGLQRQSRTAALLDLSRLMLLHLTFFFGALVVGQGVRLLLGGGGGTPVRWRPGFQERFLAGYLLLGLFLLLVVGTSVDRVGQERVQEQARSRTRAGLSLAVEQLRSLLVEQARTLAGSEYIAELLLGQLAGRRPAGPAEFQQAMVFDAEGRLLLDETLGNLSEGQARVLLDAGRGAPFVVLQEGRDTYLGAVIPIDLTDVMSAAGAPGAPEEEVGKTSGFFFYRQRLGAGLLNGLADLVRGQATLLQNGRPVLASHPEGYFSGGTPLLSDPGMMNRLLEHPGSPDVLAAPGRPFAFTGAMPLPSFGRGEGGTWSRYRIPAVLAVDFPDLEREFNDQRKRTVLFLTGLANLILLTALGLAGIMSWNIFRPLHLLSAATRSLARGDYRAPLPEPGTDEVGKLAAAFGSMREDLHTARERLAARERFLSTVLDRVPVGVAVLGEGDTLVVLNPAGRAILEAFGSGADPVRTLARLRDGFCRLGPAAAGELRSDDGRRTLRGAVADLPVPDGGTDTMLVFEDITEFLETKKLALNAELARQVAHEIKNPLTPIQLSAQLLGQAWSDRHPRLDQIVPDTVGRILQQVTLLRSIASEFSLLGRPDRLEAAPLDLEALVVQVVAAYGGRDPRPETGGDETVGEGFPGVTVGSPAPPPVLAHAESLQKILGNLMQNSLDAADPERPVRIAIRWRWDADTVTMIWEDNGTGLTGEVADRLFDPYFSTKSKGTGLGLAICRNLADRMDGSISLGNRTDGPGAVAALTLPRDPGDRQGTTS